VLFVLLTNRSQSQTTPYKLMLSGLISNTVDTITPQRAYKLNKQDKNIVFLDARERNEYEVSHIKKSNYVGYDNFRLSRLTWLDTNSVIIVYCSVGYRSEKIAEKLIKGGYTNVRNLYGGFFEWVNLGYPIVDIYDSSTTKVHGYSPEWGVWLKKGDVVYE
jgi:rhodanese-related sulfurtransferase